MSNELAKITEGFGLILASDQSVGMTGAMVEGDDDGDGDIGVSQLVMFSGSAEEEAKYGDKFKRGDFIDPLELRSLGREILFVPIGGWVTYEKYTDENGPIPVYVHSKKEDVPPEDLEWSGPERNLPPTCSKVVNMIMMIAGEPILYKFRFKRTGLPAYDRVIKPNEQVRPHSIYQFSTRPDVGKHGKAKGKAFSRLTVAFKSKSPENIIAKAQELKRELEKIRHRSESVANVDAGREPENDEGGGDMPPM